MSYDYSGRESKRRRDNTRTTRRYKHFAPGIHFVDNCIDPPRGQEEWIPVDPSFTNAVDLVKYIRSSSEFSSHFCIGVAGSLPYNPKCRVLSLNLNV